MLVADHTRYSKLGYKSADDRLSMVARDYPARGGAGSQLPLLMLHGLTRNCRDFEPLIANLSDARRMLVANQRGRGESDYDPDPQNYRPDVYVEDMWRLLEAAGVSRTILVGTSLGGLMSMMMAAQKPEQIAAIIINDIGPQVEPRGLERIRSYVGGSEPYANWDEAAAKAKAAHGEALLGLDDEGWMQFAQRTCEPTEDGKVRLSYDPAISQGVQPDDTSRSSDPSTIPPDLWTIWDNLPAIPILLLRGANSDLLEPGTVDTMRKRHKGDFQFVEIPDRGHAPLLDEPLAVSAINSFLAELA